MVITKISLSYLFLAIAIVSTAFYLYFKLLVVKTSPNSKTRGKIVGKMNDPDGWRTKNINMSFVFLFWAVLSLAIFVWLKFLYTASLISIAYIFLYLLLIAISVILSPRKKDKSTS